MWRWRRVAVARLPRTERSEGRGVFPLVVRSRIKMLYFILALAKTVTPEGGPRREPGQAHRRPLKVPF